MRARIDQVMRKNFSTVRPDEDVRTVIREVTPEATGLIPVVGKNGHLAGIIEAHDLLKGVDSNLKVQDIASQDYVVARPGQTVDEVTREMVLHNAENVVVVNQDEKAAPIGVARAADILRLRRWIVEEEIR
jgi:CBS domain-containing protein